jgi:hypothetical protein
MHPGVYVIHNDAPRSLKEIEEIRDRIDLAARKDAGISYHGNGPTPDGYLTVWVDRDAPGAQAKLDEMFGPNLIRVTEGTEGQKIGEQATLSALRVIPEHWPRREIVG